MDLDARLLALLGPLEFCWFNMMNFHFFHADSAASVYKDFLSELAANMPGDDKDSAGGRLAVVLDPPFGARHEILAATLRRIQRDARRLSGGRTSAKIFWIFPYFMERKIVQESSLDLVMSDYRVTYENHRDYSGAATKGGRKQGSPVRIFTNVPLRSVGG